MMKKIKFVLMISLLVSSKLSFSQKSIDKFIKSLNNNNLRYELYIRSPEVKKDTLYVSKYTLDIKSVDVPRLTKKFNKDELTKALINSLNDKNKDWYANMLLYAITEREAMIFTVIENRNYWLKNNNKENDLKYWEGYPH